MILKDCLAELSLYEYSQEYFDILKDLNEVALADRFIENQLILQESAEDLGISDDAVITESFLMEAVDENMLIAIYEKSVTKKRNLLLVIFKGFQKMGKMIIGFLRSIFKKNKKSDINIKNTNNTNNKRTKGDLIINLKLRLEGKGIIIKNRNFINDIDDSVHVDDMIYRIIYQYKINGIASHAVDFDILIDTIKHTCQLLTSDEKVRPTNFYPLYYQLEDFVKIQQSDGAETRFGSKNRYLDYNDAINDINDMMIKLSEPIEELIKISNGEIPISSKYYKKFDWLNYCINAIFELYNLLIKCQRDTIMAISIIVNELNKYINDCIANGIDPYKRSNGKINKTVRVNFGDDDFDDIEDFADDK